MFLGFAMYLLVLSLHRSLIFDPLVVETARADKPERDRLTRHALTATLCGSLVATALMLVAGTLSDHPLARGIYLFAPWMVPAMLQDLWRATLFRDDRGGAAALNDLVWVVVMIVALPLALTTDAGGVVVACWGLGAVGGGVLGFFQTHAGVSGLRAAWSWWLLHGWPLGRWLAAGGLVHTVSLQVIVGLLASVLGPAAIGGFRAVQTVFAPMTLLGPAAALPGLPRISRAVGVSLHEARVLAAKLSAAIVGLASIYILAVLLGGSKILTFVFGGDFGGYEDLIPPMSLGQVVLASGLGFSLYLKAVRRGDSLMGTRLISAGTSLALVPWLGSKYGLIGAAWGFVVSTTLENGAVAAFSLSKRFGTPRPRSASTVADDVTVRSVSGVES